MPPLKVAASSPTFSHHTFVSVQEPLQWTPSAAGSPRITFFSVAPSASSNSGSWSSSCESVPRAPLPTNRFRPPSKVPETAFVAVRLVVPVAVGQVAAEAPWV